jgi:folylpolyglutamate synthase/dihydropteroate synthase
MPQALQIAFSGGSVMGLGVVGLGITGVALAFALFGENGANMDIVTGFGLGASSIALFARVGGGIYTKAAEVGADLFWGTDKELTCLSDSLEGQQMCLTYPNFQKNNQATVQSKSSEVTLTFTLPLLGNHQRDNASCVLALFDGLNRKGFTIPPEVISKGMESVCFPGRFEIIQRRPLILIDGAHNPDGAETFAKNIRHYFDKMPVHLYLGMLGDKDVDSVLNILLPIADVVTVLTPSSKRAMSAENLAAKIKGISDVRVTIAQTVDDAVVQIRDDGFLHAFTGSLHLIGHVRKAVLAIGRS